MSMVKSRKTAISCYLDELHFVYVVIGDRVLWSTAYFFLKSFLHTLDQGKHNPSFSNQGIFCSVPSCPYTVDNATLINTRPTHYNTENTIFRVLLLAIIPPADYRRLVTRQHLWHLLDFVRCRLLSSLLKVIYSFYSSMTPDAGLFYLVLLYVF